MALAWTVTDRDAFNIYNKFCNYWDGSQLPTGLNDAGVFFGYANFTKDKLIYAIQYLKDRWSSGWFTNDAEERREILNQLANELYRIYAGDVDIAGINKFLHWVSQFAHNDADAVEYFHGGSYSLLDSIKDTFTQKVVEPTSEAVETVSYGVKYPSFTMSNPLVKWAIFGSACVIAYKLLTKR